MSNLTSSLTSFTSLTLLLSLSSLPACAVAQGDDPSEQEDVATAEQQERWSADDDPSLFSATMVRAMSALPDRGEAKNIPWAGSYWPTAEDSINARWDGAASQSPAKKYEVAFGKSGVEDKVSQYHGIDSMSSSASCTEDAQCDKDQGEICSKRAGASSGRCIPTWFGICHAWAPAAILTQEPKHAVVKNGVTFKVQDIKALVSLVHDETTTKFISLRCDTNEKEIAFDEYGRPTSDCRDTNAGTYHLILANYLGLQKVSFVEDRTYDDQVWNQPMRGYQIQDKRVVTAEEANALIGVRPKGTSKTASGTVKAGVWAHQTAITVKPGERYNVAMKGTGDADLYVRFGAKPTSSTYVCRPYQEGSDETCAGVVPAGATAMYVSVKGYAASSTYELDIATGTVPSAYVFNNAAASLMYVRNKVSYISESPSSKDGNLASQIDQYTAQDEYEYILELDASGAIIGGEWVGASKRSHPDFLWLPTGAGAASVAGGLIRYSDVKALLDASIAP